MLEGLYHKGNCLLNLLKFGSFSEFFHFQTSIMSPLIPIIFTALASSALGEEGQARILISKQVRQIHKMTIILYYSIYSHLQINNKYLVEGMDIVVKYNLYNVGDNAATNVQVENLDRE